MRSLLLERSVSLNLLQVESEIDFAESPLDTPSGNTPIEDEIFGALLKRTASYSAQLKKGGSLPDKPLNRAQMELVLTKAELAQYDSAAKFNPPKAKALNNVIISRLAALTPGEGGSSVISSVTVSTASGPVAAAAKKSGNAPLPTKSTQTSPKDSLPNSKDVPGKVSVTGSPNFPGFEPSDAASVPPEGGSPAAKSPSPVPAVAGTKSRGRPKSSSIEMHPTPLV